MCVRHWARHQSYRDEQVTACSGDTPGAQSKVFGQDWNHGNPGIDLMFWLPIFPSQRSDAWYSVELENTIEVFGRESGFTQLWRHVCVCACVIYLIIGNNLWRNSLHPFLGLCQVLRAQVEAYVGRRMCRGRDSSCCTPPSSVHAPYPALPEDGSSSLHYRLPLASSALFLRRQPPTS